MNQAPIAELMNLKNKTALITGGAMGIGFGIAYRLAEAGANAMIVDLNAEAGRLAAQKLNERGWPASFVQADVSREDDVAKAIDATLDTYHGLDILVNNAGIYPIIPVQKTPLKDFEKVLNVNLKSVFLLTKAAGQVMIKQGRGGKIINITSIDAIHPSAVGLAIYDASKHGLWGFTKNTALELAPYHIQVNAIAPGGINTPGTGAGAPKTAAIEAIQKKFIGKIPLQRLGEPDDIGKVALFLASDMSSYMTGAQIVVDGGVLLA